MSKSQVWVLRKCRQRIILWILMQAMQSPPKRKDYGIFYSNPKPYQKELHGARCQGHIPLKNQSDEVAENEAETKKKPVARDCWGSEESVPQTSTATVGATQQTRIDALPRQMRIDELPPWQPSTPWQPPPHGQHGGFKPSTWPPPYLTEAHIQRLIDLMEKNGLEFDHAVQVLGMECAWTSRDLPHRFKAPPPQPPSLNKIPQILSKTFIEEEARALFHSQEIDKVNKEMPSVKRRLTIVVERRKQWPALALLMRGHKCLRLRTKEALLIISDLWIPGARRQMAMASRPVPRNLTKGPFQLEAKDTNGSLNTMAIIASPIKVPLELVKDQDGFLAKDKDGGQNKGAQWSKAFMIGPEEQQLIPGHKAEKGQVYGPLPWKNHTAAPN